MQKNIESDVIVDKEIVSMPKKRGARKYRPKYKRKKKRRR